MSQAGFDPPWVHSKASCLWRLLRISPLSHQGWMLKQLVCEECFLGECVFKNVTKWKSWYNSCRCCYEINDMTYLWKIWNNCCGFWLAFGRCAYLKAGQNTFLVVFKHLFFKYHFSSFWPFLFEQKKKLWKKSCVLVTTYSWLTPKWIWKQPKKLFWPAFGCK